MKGGRRNHRESTVALLLVYSGARKKTFRYKRHVVTGYPRLTDRGHGFPIHSDFDTAGIARHQKQVIAIRHQVLVTGPQNTREQEISILAQDLNPTFGCGLDDDACFPVALTVDSRLAL